MRERDPNDGSRSLWKTGAGIVRYMRGSLVVRAE